MANYSTIPRELAEFLHNERGSLLPFIGAGVSVSAGIPAAKQMAGLIASSARDEGAEIPQCASFTVVCAAVSAQLGHLRLQQTVAEIVDTLPIEPTSLQRLIVRAPARKVVTTNFDQALRLAADEAGLKPVVRTAREARALETPRDGEVMIVHLHGHTGDPAGMALPGESMAALATDEAFKAVLRGLVTASPIVYLGYRLPPEDEYLHAEIEALSLMFADRGPHRVLLPQKEFERRTAEMTALAEFGVVVDTFDSDRGYQALDQAALLVAPSNTVEGSDVLPLVRDAAEYYLAPTLLREAPERDQDGPDNRLLMVRMGFPDDTVCSPPTLLGVRRAIIVGEPGMGKTQLLHHLADIEMARVPLTLRLKDLAGQLQPDGDVERDLAAALAQARAFSEDVKVPTRDALEGNAYLLLFDALDEVAPDRRSDVIRLLTAADERYPQHSIVVTSRVNSDAMALGDADFELFRIPRDDDWGRRYLRHRGIPDERVARLFDEVETLSDLLAVPQYASLIGERLADEPLEPIPTTGFGLMIDVGVKAAVNREGALLGYSADQLYRWLRLLGVSFELRGRLSGSVEEVSEIPGPEQLRTTEIREQFVERALLQDTPDRVALQANAVQEALAADALLDTSDPLATLKEAAMTEIVGIPTFRADLDHMIDLFYEGAPTELRPALREFDELRWARTTRADAPVNELEEALDALWEIYDVRRVWVDRNRGREVRDARSAVARLVRVLAEVGDVRRTKWTDATQSPEPTTRANASIFLRQLPVNEGTRPWLEPLLADPNSVVRRHAASACLELSELGRQLLPALEIAYAAETDELAAQAIGSTIFELLPAERRVETLAQLAENPQGWGRISYLVTALPLGEALAVFDRTGIRNDSDEQHLADVVSKAGAEEWTDRHVHTLVRLLLQSQRSYHREFRERALLEELARAHPEAALAGVRDGAQNDLNWNDLSFLQSIPRETLRAAAAGDLEGPLLTLLEILDLREARVAEPAPRQPERATQPSTLLELLQSGALEATAREGIPRPLLESYVRQSEELATDQRQQLGDIVEGLWPQPPLASALIIEGNSGQAQPELEPALAFSTALDLPLPADRWMDIFETGAVFFWWPATDWLSRHAEGLDEERVIGRFAQLETEFQVRQALNSVHVVTPSIADAAATALLRIDAADSVFMLHEFRERRHLDALRRIRVEANAPAMRRGAQRELAAAGDVDAQRTELQQMLEDIAANPNAYSDDGIAWASSATPDAMDELAALLQHLARVRSAGFSRMDQTVHIALAATGDERAIEAYDTIIGDASIEGASFLRYQRDELARTMSRDQALDRLPERLSDVAQWMIDRGLNV